MAKMNTMKDRLCSSPPTPPPSPIPTGKGSRSAASSIFSDYIDRSKQIPDLILPDYFHRLVLVDINYELLKTRDRKSMNLLFRSGMELGVFGISGHGILAEELGSTVVEAELLFYSDYGEREEFTWCPTDEAMVERVMQVMGAKAYRSFSQKMENIASKLVAIGEEVSQIISKNKSQNSRTKFEPNDSKLSLYRHNISTPENKNPHSPDEIREDSCKYALSLHLPVGQGKFYVQSERGPLSFNTSPKTIIVTIGEQIEEWSLGEFKSAYGELNFEPDIHGSQPYFSFELKFSPSNLNMGIKKTISIRDQILIILILALVYKFVLRVYM